MHVYIARDLSSSFTLTKPDFWVDVLQVLGANRKVLNPILITVCHGKEN
jgi:hypothetical protein